MSLTHELTEVFDVTNSFIDEIKQNNINIISIKSVINSSLSFYYDIFLHEKVEKQYKEIHNYTDIKKVRIEFNQYSNSIYIQVYYQNNIDEVSNYLCKSNYHSYNILVNLSDINSIKRIICDSAKNGEFTYDNVIVSQLSTIEEDEN